MKKSWTLSAEKINLWITLNTDCRGRLHISQFTGPKRPIKVDKRTYIFIMYDHMIAKFVPAKFDRLQRAAAHRRTCLPIMANPSGFRTELVKLPHNAGYILQCRHIDSVEPYACVSISDFGKFREVIAEIKETMEAMVAENDDTPPLEGIAQANEEDETDELSSDSEDESDNVHNDPEGPQDDQPSTNKSDKDGAEMGAGNETKGPQDSQPSTSKPNKDGAGMGAGPPEKRSKL